MDQISSNSNNNNNASTNRSSNNKDDALLFESTGLNNDNNTNKTTTGTTNKRKTLTLRFIYGILTIFIISGITLLMDRKMINLTSSMNSIISSVKDTTSIQFANITSSTTTDSNNRREEIMIEEEEENKIDDNNKLNIVLFYADDWSFNMIGAMGNQYIKTPNIDQLANEGILFTHNCVVTSVCMQSRATLYTGQYTSRHLTYYSWRNVVMYEIERWKNTLYPIMLNAAYYVGFFGKYHHNEPPPLPSFSKFRSAPYSHYFTRDGMNQHVTQWNENDGIEFLNTRPMNETFFLTISFFATHAEDGSEEQYRPMNTSMNLYVDDDVPIPKTFTQRHWEELPYFINEQNVGRARFRPRYGTPELYQHHMKNTCRMVTEVDTAIGNVIKVLKEQNVYNNTLIIFTTDNGNMHGQHGLAEKWYAYEESLRVPLVIKDPRMLSKYIGTKNDEFTLNIDLAPTILAAAGITPPNVMQGRNIASMYINNDKVAETAISNWRKEFIYEFHDDNPHIRNSIALVNKDFKYIIWDEYNYTQLFHLLNDPYEEYDLLNPRINDTNYINYTTSITNIDDIHQMLIEYSKRLDSLLQAIPNDGTF